MYGVARCHSHLMCGQGAFGILRCALRPLPDFTLTTTLVRVEQQFDFVPSMNSALRNRAQPGAADSSIHVGKAKGPGFGAYLWHMIVRLKRRWSHDQEQVSLPANIGNSKVRRRQRRFNADRTENHGISFNILPAVTNSVV